MKYNPTQDFLLVEEIPEKETAGGLVLPDNREQENQQFRVLKAGPGMWRDGVFVETTIEEGQVVIAANGPVLQLEVVDGKRIGLLREIYVITTVERAPCNGHAPAPSLT